MIYKIYDSRSVKAIHNCKTQYLGVRQSLNAAVCAEWMPFLTGLYVRLYMRQLKREVSHKPGLATWARCPLPSLDIWLPLWWSTAIFFLFWTCHGISKATPEGGWCEEALVSCSCPEALRTKLCSGLCSHPVTGNGGELRIKWYTWPKNWEGNGARLREAPLLKTIRPTSNNHIHGFLKNVMNKRQCFALLF